MNKLISFFFCTFICSYSFADAPLSEPAEYRVCNWDISFCAISVPSGNTTVYSISGEFDSQQLYSVPGWHRSIFISPNGKYLLVGYSRLNLVPLDITKDEVMLKIYKNGSLVMSFTLGQLLVSMDSLEPTASHYHWGQIGYISDKDIWVKTVEGDVNIELKNGKVHRQIEI